MVGKQVTLVLTSLAW